MKAIKLLMTFTFLNSFLLSCGQNGGEGPDLDPDFRSDTFGGAGSSSSPILKGTGFRADNNTTKNLGGGSGTSVNKAGASQNSSQNSLSLGGSFEITHEGRQKFLCEVKDLADSFNDEIRSQRQEANYIFESLKNGVASRDDRIRLSELLIEYRMMVPWTKKDFYFSPTRYDYIKIMELTREAAQDYINQNPTGPFKCHFTTQYINDLGKKAYRWNSYDITNPVCEQQLLKQMQIIPAGQVMAQAVEESGWGTSNLAQQANNFYGMQLRFSNIDSLLKRPFCRQAQQAPNRCLFVFNSLDDSTREYYRTLNAGPYQTDYRNTRQNSSGDLTRCLDAKKTIKGLTNYAENTSYQVNLNNHLSEICQMAEQCSN